MNGGPGCCQLVCQPPRLPAAPGPSPPGCASTCTFPTTHPPPLCCLPPTQPDPTQPLADLAAILAIDWLLDRVRTCVNLLGDAYGCVMVDHLMQRRPHGRHSHQAGGLGAAEAEGLGGGGSGKPEIPYFQLEMGLQEPLPGQPLQPQRT